MFHRVLSSPLPLLNEKNKIIIIIVIYWTNDGEEEELSKTIGYLDHNPEW
jgi:hypothetical protein